MGLDIIEKEIDWNTFRLIPSRDPPIDLFGRVASPDEFDDLFEIESLTNDRLRAEQNRLYILPREEWIFGNNVSYLMAPFFHLNPEGSRFSDGTFGIYYCAKRLETAIAETKYHREVFLRRTNEPPMHIEMREIKAQLKGGLHDVRNLAREFADVYSPSSYSAGQKLGLELRAKGSYGVLFKSVRDPGSGRNDCAAVFRPKVLSNPEIGAHYIYNWDGLNIVSIYEKR